MTHQTWFDQHAKDARLTRTRSLSKIMIPHHIMIEGHSYASQIAAARKVYAQ
jgi:hypothetical protein